MVQIIAREYFLRFQVLDYKQIYTNQRNRYLKSQRLEEEENLVRNLPADGDNVVADAAAAAAAGK